MSACNDMYIRYRLCDSVSIYDLLLLRVTGRL